MSADAQRLQWRRGLAHCTRSLLSLPLGLSACALSACRFCLAVCLRARCLLAACSSRCQDSSPHEGVNFSNFLPAARANSFRAPRRGSSTPAPAGGPRARGFLPRPAAAALGLPHLRRPAPRSLRVRKTSRPGTVRDFRLLRRLDSDTPTGFTAYRVRVIKKYLATKNPFPIQNDRLSAVPPLADAMWSSSPAPETIASSDSRPVTISSERTPSQAQSSQPAVTISSTDESRTIEVPVACPVVDLTAGVGN